LEHLNNFHRLLKYLSIAVNIFLCLLASGQTRNNYVRINADDDTATIIGKAASVTPSARQLRWQKLELTAFLHFGINTFTDREWGDGKEDPKLFNPAALDAEQWIKTLKAAGFRQAIITAKHHDGFCLWPSAFTDHSVKNSSWNNGDVVKEVADACHKYDIGFGVYLSPWDRNSVYYGDSATYNQYFINQLTELLTHYGRVDEVWFDGANGEGKNGKKQVYDFERWYQLIRKLQPQAVIAVMGPDVRWVGTETGYGRETEWSVLPLEETDQKNISDNSQNDIAFIPKGDRMGEDLGSRYKILSANALVWYPAETDVSIRDGWFYHEKDRVKSPEQLMDIYFNSVGRNGVLLLNIPPDRNGRINRKDSIALMGFRKLRDETFSKNLLKQAKIISSAGTNEKALVDGKYNTYWKGDRDSLISIEFRLNRKGSFNVFMIQENISVGQRIEKFRLEIISEHKVQKVVEGTTVGYKRLIRFETVVGDRIVLRLEAVRGTPAIAETGVFREKNP
jgi:alpha-L-fucosidase